MEQRGILEDRGARGAGGAREAREAREARQDAGSSEGSALRRCDFCGAASPTVRRIALDQGYDRLLLPHRELYACPPCSEAKERQRLGPRQG